MTRDSCTWAYEVSDDDDVDDNDVDGDDDENVPLISALDRSFSVHEALREDLENSQPRSPTQGLELELGEIPPSDEDTTLNPELHTGSQLVSPPTDVDPSSAAADSTPNADSSMPLFENSCTTEITCSSNTADSLSPADPSPSTDSPALDS